MFPESEFRELIQSISDYRLKTSPAGWVQLSSIELYMLIIFYYPISAKYRDKCILKGVFFL